MSELKKEIYEETDAEEMTKTIIDFFNKWIEIKYRNLGDY